jgi:hypothetical protein
MMGLRTCHKELVGSNEDAPGALIVQRRRGVGMRKGIALAVQERGAGCVCWDWVLCHLCQPRFSSTA